MGLNSRFLWSGLSPGDNHAQATYLLGASWGSMRTWWKQSKGAFRHYNLSEGSWPFSWCLWEAGGIAVSFLALCIFNPTLWDRSRLEGDTLDKGRQRCWCRDRVSGWGFPDSSLSLLPSPCRAAPAAFLCFLSFWHPFTLLGHLND